MKLESKRTTITPLSRHEMELFVRSREDYEKHAKVKFVGHEMIDGYCIEIEELLAREPEWWSSKGKEYLFHTLWLIVEKETRMVIGHFLFNGHPNEHGEVDIFFGIEKPYRRKGYATEVMTTILKWGACSKLFKKVLVEADETNRAAMASLKKLGFKKMKRDDEDPTQILKYYRIVYANDPCIDDLEVDPIKDMPLD